MLQIGQKLIDWNGDNAVLVAIGSMSPLMSLTGGTLQPCGASIQIVVNGEDLRHSTESDIYPMEHRCGAIGRYYVTDGEPATATECAKLLNDAQTKRDRNLAERAKAREAKEAERERLRIHAPDWAKAAIIAELMRDDCDLMTDYFHATATTTLLLSWSKHTRDLFPEMRKVAGNAAELAGIDWKEHREKYSMGAGYYLSETNGYHGAGGWIIRKTTLYGDRSISAHNRLT